MTVALPRLLVLTDRRQSEHAGRGLTDTVRRAVDAGAEAVLLREKDLPVAERAALANQLRGTVPMLLVASDAVLATAVGANGVHLAAHDPMPDANPSLVVGRSCHSAVSVRRAITEGASYVTLSPVFANPSKPDYGPALGPDALAGHPGAVWALGGITTPQRAAACIRAGASGVAVLGAVVGAPNPSRVVADLLAAIDSP